MGASVADGGPRTIRDRRAIAAAFTGIAAEIRAAGALLQSALALLVQEQAGASAGNAVTAVSKPREFTYQRGWAP